MNNPTALRVGAVGMMDGRRYRVAGRVVMGMEEAGETYYWNEFNLVDDAGNSITLVFEETENGPEWKLFTLFEPNRPISVAEASQKQVGETVNLDGMPTPITLVDQSRVYFIEGTASEGVEVGDIAHYFNADAGDRMVVASWTGDEVECYHGVDMPAKLVASSFNLPNLTAPSLALAGDSVAPDVPAGLIGKWIVIAIIAGVAIAGYLWWRQPKKPTARPAPIPASGSAAYVAVIVKRPGGDWYWHEYRLLDGTLFINGLTGNPKDWHRFRAATASLTAKQAGGKRSGDSVEFDSYTMRVQDLFEAAGKFGFVARAGNESGLARWTETTIEFYRGQPVTEKEALAVCGKR
jgi:hypothetical protein